MKKIFSIILLWLIFLFYLSVSVSAQTETVGKSPKEETLEAVITRIVEEKEIRVMGKKQLYQKLELLVTQGSIKDKKIIIENGKLPLANILKYKINDEVLVNYSKANQGKENFFISDYIRRNNLFWLFIIFVILTLTIAKWRGISSLLGMGVAFLVIFVYILPQILSGKDPVMIVITASLMIIPLTFYLSHGFNQKTTVAVIGTFISLIITGLLASIFIESTKLTGLSSEEAGFLFVFKQGAVNMKGLLLAGIIIGALGVLDDITISQSAIVFQLKEANEKLEFNELYRRAMNVGQDHISSMVNTLILVYTGAALPLLLLFIDNPHPFSEIVNYEIIAEEIVRTLVGSIGLILAVPITTVIASFVAEKTRASR